MLASSPSPFLIHSTTNPADNGPFLECRRLDDLVDAAKWVYYVTKTLKYLEGFPFPAP